MKRDKQAAVTGFEMLGKASIITGMQYAIDQLQKQLTQLRAELSGGLPENREDDEDSEIIDAIAALTETPKPAKEKTPSVIGGWAGTTSEQRSAEMKRRRKLWMKKHGGDSLDFFDGWYTKDGVAKALHGTISPNAVVATWRSQRYRSKTVLRPGTKLKVLIFHPGDVAREAKRRGFHNLGLELPKTAAAAPKSNLPRTTANERERKEKKWNPRMPATSEDGWYTIQGAMDAAQAGRTKIETAIREKKLRMKKARLPGLKVAVTLINPEDLKKFAGPIVKLVNGSGSEAVQ